MKISQWAGIAVASAVVATLGVLAARAIPSTHKPASNPTAISLNNPNVDPGTDLGLRPAPAFTLTNQFGQSVSLSQFRGKVVLLAFADDECTTICPLTTMSMVEAKHLLGSAGTNVQLLGVNANPTHTSVADVHAFSAAHGMLTDWQFLTGTPAALKRVWQAYGIAVAISQGAIDHTPALYIIDQQGREVKLYLTQMAYASITQQAEILARELARLLPGHPRVAQPVPPAPIPGIGPADRTTLPTLAATGARGSLSIGPGHPHLYVFFATWLGQTSNLPAEMVGLNQYVTQARAAGWPSLVAVDEAPTEPSPAALSQFLHALPVPLSYPVGIDVKGQIADGYGVQDQPWFVLTSSQGRIVWSHDGWLAVSQLTAAVAHALPAHS